MSLANVKMNPIPIGDGSGKFVKIDRQFGTIKQITRVFKAAGSSLNRAANIESFAFDDYGTLDGETTAPATFRRTVKASEKFENCYLETQEAEKGSGDSKDVLITKVYQEAYDTIREVAKPVKVKDENGRKTTQRTYVVLKDEVPASGIGDTITTDPDDGDQVLITQSVNDGNAVSIVERTFQEATNTLTQLGNDLVTYSETGLKQVEQRFFVRQGFNINTAGIVGETVGATGEISGLYLSTIAFADRNATTAIVIKRWSEPGITDAEKEFARDGLLYVTFRSQGIRIVPTALNPSKAITDPEWEAFVGGPAADLFKVQTRQVSGFRIYTTTVMMLQDGDPLGEGDNEVNSYQKWVPYKKPGNLFVNSDALIADPAVNRSLRVNIQEFFSKSPNMGTDFRPYSVSNWAYWYAQYTPTKTGIREFQSEAATGYLADSDVIVTNGDFWGEEVDSAIAEAGSNPIPSVFYSLSNQVINSDNDPAFVTDEGVKWYRKVKITVDGTFGEHLLV